jgi:4-hydroxy-3-methylbut-2-enyl diphosphate reductase
LKVTLSKHAGFCPGVRRADVSVNALLALQNAKIYTLGNLIHNESYMERLDAFGVRVIGESELTALCESARSESPVTVFVRAHGMTVETERLLFELNEKNPSLARIFCRFNYLR